MVQLMKMLVGLLTDILVFWATPIVGAALFSSVAAVIIAVNPLVGAAVVIIVAALLVIYCLREGAVWQAVLWGSLLVPYGLLATFAPHLAVLWGLGISLLAIGVLLIPGAILPHARGILTVALIATVVFHTVLSFTVWSGGIIFLTVLGLIAVAVGSTLFSRGARPWEIRRAQRVAGRLAVLSGLVLITVGLIGPRLSMPALRISVPKPVVSVWDAVTSRTEAWAIASKRSLIGERAKTEALSELEPKLQRAHKTRWEEAIKKIPTTPLNQEEWKEMGVPDP